MLLLALTEIFQIFYSIQYRHIEAPYLLGIILIDSNLYEVYFVLFLKMLNNSFCSLHLPSNFSRKYWKRKQLKIFVPSICREFVIKWSILLCNLFLKSKKQVDDLIVIFSFNIYTFFLVL